MMHQPARGPRPRNADPTLLLAFLLPVFAWAPLSYPGYFVLRSGYVPIFNLVDRLAHPGDFAWLPTVGTGHHLFSGAGSLPYWLAALPAALGASPADAVKWVFALAFVAGSAGCYAWARRCLLDGWPALVAASLYVFNPVWLADVFSRGAFAEAVLIGLLPWVLWAADAAAAGRRTAPAILALLVAACVWTQAALGLAFALTVLVYLFVACRMRRSTSRGFARAGAGLLAGIALAALGLLPALLRSGAGPVEPLQSWQWFALLAPWLALFGGWIAARLAAMLPGQGDAERAPLFAALIALALLGAYAGVRPVASAAAVPSAPLAIFGENEIALLSVETEGTPGPGGRVALEVAWQALKPLAHDYTVFFHVIGANGERYGQLDTMPQGGTLPTTQWQPGEVIRDRYETALSPGAPIEDQYRYWVGWYQGETGQRLPLSQVLAEGPGLSPGQDDKYMVAP